MSHDEELRSERVYVTGLYARLDAERARVQGEHEAALRGHGATAVERDVEVRATAKQVKRLRVADSGLCFGRLDTLSGERSYIGRIGLSTRRTTTCRCCWTGGHRRRAPSTPPPPRPRRAWRSAASSTRAGATSSTSPTRSSTARGAAALLATVNAPRGEGMRDIVATIQAEQDEIIRLDHPGVLVIGGGPGTGKTVVALHRVAYLVYTQRERIERGGVLVVGPNPAFLNHISRVLPSLGESGVVFTTTGELVPGLHVTAEDSPDAARLKGSLGILDVLAAAVRARQRLPERPSPIELADTEVRIDAGTAKWAREEARASGLPHNEARAVFTEIVTYVLAERGSARVGRGWLSRDDRDAWRDLRADLRKELVEHPALGRADGAAWTVSDVPLLDELVDLLAELYVALTRATQRLGVLHHGRLPLALTGLADTGTPAPPEQRRSG